MKYKILECNTVYDGYFKIDELEIKYDSFSNKNIKPQIREVFERGQAAAIIPYDPVRDEIIWIEQFRVGALQSGEEPWTIETVAGIIETGETAEDVVYREALEETGCELQNIEKIASYLVSPGGSSEVIHLYCGKADTSNVDAFHGVSEEGEDIRAHVLSFADSVKWYESGKLNSATPIIAMQWLILNCERLRSLWLKP